jgi:ABC-type uncharacterized transport system substrate-binding protein
MHFAVNLETRVLKRNIYMCHRLSSTIRLSTMALALFVGYWLTAISSVRAMPLEIELRHNSSNRFIAELAGSLRERLSRAPEKYALRDRNAPPSDTATPIIVTLGSDAFKTAISERPRRRILAAAIPRPVFVSTLESQGLTPEMAGEITGIFVGQSVRHNLALLRAAFPKSESVCALDTKNIPFRAPAHVAAKAFGFTPVVIAVESPLDLLQKVDVALSRCDMLWITHDTSAVTGETVRPLLLTALRQGKAVLGGIVPDFVEQGALATISSTSENIEYEITKRLESFNRSRTLGTSGYASEWRIWVNRSVATTLKLEVPDDALLRQRIVRSLEER